MRKSILVFTCSIVITLYGCSSESLKRVGYETMQNISHEQCEKDYSSECPERLNYDEYQRNKNKL